MSKQRDYDKRASRRAWFLRQMPNHDLDDVMSFVKQKRMQDKRMGGSDARAYAWIRKRAIADQGQRRRMGRRGKP